jgi:hypothetical protein
VIGPGTAVGQAGVQAALGAGHRGAVSAGVGGRDVGGLSPGPGVLQLESVSVAGPTPDGSRDPWRRREMHHPVRTHPDQRRPTGRSGGRTADPNWWTHQGAASC